MNYILLVILFVLYFVFVLCFVTVCACHIEIKGYLLTYTWCGLSANLECRSEMYCTRLTENIGRKKSPKIRHLGTISQRCSAVSSQLRHVSTIGKKLIKQPYLIQMMSSQYGELRPTIG